MVAVGGQRTYDAPLIWFLSCTYWSLLMKTQFIANVDRSDAAPPERRVVVVKGGAKILRSRAFAIGVVGSLNVVYVTLFAELM